MEFLAVQTLLRGAAGHVGPVACGIWVVAASSSEGFGRR